MLRQLGIADDSPSAPTHEALLNTQRKISKSVATRIFRDASGASNQRKAERQITMGMLGISQLNVSELDFNSYCRAASDVAKHLTEERIAPGIPAETTLVASHSGLKIERVERERMSKRAWANKMKASIEMSPLKRGMPKAFEPYREERRKLLFSNLPAAFQSPDAPPMAEGEDERAHPPSDDPIHDQVLHFVSDRILFYKYCMIEGHSALQSGSRQKSMDLKEFLHMAKEIGALKSGEHGHGASKSKAKDHIAGGEGRIPAIHGLERSLLTKHQATNCFRAAMAQATTQSLIASGELNYDLYKIASRLLAKIYVHGEPRVEEEPGSKPSGRASCPPVIPTAPFAHSNTEIYTKIVEKLVRPRPNGEDALLDGVENLLLVPEVFEKFCALEGHSDLQLGSRRSTMDQYEWLRCLADLGLMPPDQLRENKIMDMYVQKPKKKKAAAQYAGVVEQLERRLSKEQAVNTFRQALGKASSKYGAPVGELNFRRFCVAAQIAAKLLVHGENNSYPELRQGEGQGAVAGKSKRRVVELQVQKRKGALVLPEWDAHFSTPAKRLPVPAGKSNESNSHQTNSAVRVSAKGSSDVTQASVTQPSVERVLSDKSMELAQAGDRAMLRKEFTARFATRVAFSKHAQKQHKDGGEGSEQCALSPAAALHEAVVQTLMEAHLVPDFVGQAALLHMLSTSLPDSSASLHLSPAKSVSFGVSCAPAASAAGDTHTRQRLDKDGRNTASPMPTRMPEDSQVAAHGADKCGAVMQQDMVQQDIVETRTSEAGVPTCCQPTEHRNQTSSPVHIREGVVEIVSAPQVTDTVRDSMQGAYAVLLWPYAAFRTTLERVAEKIDIEALKAFLDSPHAWCHVVSAYDYVENANAAHAKHGRKAARRAARIVPPTPWTQAHPTASHRPRTSVRVLMLNQKELRRQHVHAQQRRQDSELKRLNCVKAEEDRKVQIESVKESKRLRWQDALNQVDAKIIELRREENTLLHSQRNRRVAPPLPPLHYVLSLSFFLSLSLSLFLSLSLSLSPSLSECGCSRRQWRGQ